MIFRVAIAVVAVFVLWTGLEIVVHAVLLADTYTATAELWRPQEEMKMGLMAAVRLTVTVAFVLIYALLIRPKSPKTGLAFGLVLGVASGVSMGYGTYSFMPIPQAIATYWFLATVTKFAAAGIITGMIVKDNLTISESGTKPN